MEKLLEALRRYTPWNEQEEKDRSLILEYLSLRPSCFLRSDRIAHMTASAWIVNQSRTKVLMVYHNLYDSWAWTGGHADGETDLLKVALKECREETGVCNVRPLSEDIYSLEVLTVDGHEKKGQYLSSHLHLNVTYLLEAEEKDELSVCEAENSGVSWFSLDDAVNASSEPWFRERIYSKLNAKLSSFPSE